MLNGVCSLSAIIIIILIVSNHLETLLHNIHCVHNTYVRTYIQRSCVTLVFMTDKSTIQVTTVSVDGKEGV